MTLLWGQTPDIFDQSKLNPDLKISISSIQGYWGSPWGISELYVYIVPLEDLEGSSARYTREKSMRL